jgi:tetratricopeptide (TPR) repeat protein
LWVAESIGAGEVVQGRINQGATQPVLLSQLTAENLLERAVKKSQLGDKQGAIADYDQAIQLQPDFAVAYKNRGGVKSDLGDKQGAIADFNQAIQLEPDFAEAYFNRGNVKYGLGDKQGALSDYQTAAKLFQQQGNTEGYQFVRDRIQELQK